MDHQWITQHNKTQQNTTQHNAPVACLAKPICSSSPPLLPILITTSSNLDSSYMTVTTSNHAQYGKIDCPWCQKRRLSLALLGEDGNQHETQRATNSQRREKAILSSLATRAGGHEALAYRVRYCNKMGSGRTRLGQNYGSATPQPTNLPSAPAASHTTNSRAHAGGTPGQPPQSPPLPALTSHARDSTFPATNS